MAHMQKFAKAAVYGLAVHNERRKGCELSNKDIDLNRTHLNYNLASTIQPLPADKFVSQRVDEVHHLKRKDVIQMVDWIVTLPKNVPTEEEKRFFEHTFKFISSRYGEQNIVSGWVHNDESTPHIHISFVPVIVKDGMEKLDCKSIMTKKELKSFHSDLEDYLTQELGYRPEIQNGATINGNRSIKELKASEDLSLKESLSNIHKHIEASNEIMKSAENIDFKKSNFVDKIKTASKVNEVIDELRNSNEKLNSDTKALTKLVITQKAEIDSYRNMPLAKQMKRKDIEMDQLNSSIDELEKKIDDYKFDIKMLNQKNESSNRKIEKLETELDIHKSFISFLGLDKLFKKFKNRFLHNREFHLNDVIDMCVNAIKSVSNMKDALIERICFLKDKNIDEDIVYRGNNTNNITRGER